MANISNENQPSNIKRRSSFFRPRSLFRHKASATERLNTKYEVTSTSLGTGHYGSVWLGVLKTSGKHVAIKSIGKKNLSRGKLKVLHREVNITSVVSHTGIVQMIEYFEDSKNLHIVMEMVKGCDMFDRVTEMGYFNEDQARSSLRDILKPLAYLHSQGIAHRDIKPENIMTTNSQGDDSLDIKLIDFGLSKAIARRPSRKARYTGNNKPDLLHKMTSRVGTPCFMAPEIIDPTNETYGPSFDLWAVGCVFYILLCGFPPFYGDTNDELFEEIIRADVDFSDPSFDSVSLEAKDLVCSLLAAEPSTRLTADEALLHPFFTGTAQQCSSSSGRAVPTPWAHL